MAPVERRPGGDIMQAKAIETGERRAAVLGRAAILSAAVLAGGCAQILGIEDLPPLPVDAGPSGFAVRGSATGVLGPVALELRLGDGVELLAVTQDGIFMFETRLENGTRIAWHSRMWTCRAHYATRPA
jgi:hypothetical protein